MNIGDRVIVTHPKSFLRGKVGTVCDTNLFGLVGINLDGDPEQDILAFSKDEISVIDIPV